MILAPTLTLNALRGPSVDPDAAAFAATSGATDVAALSAFVKGVKDLGLWNNMVCWPLRSSQNAGTGTTAYSLGGLGTFNGTLVNGPTWGTDGITFASTSSQRIDTTATVSLANGSVLFGAYNYTQTDPSVRSGLYGGPSQFEPQFFNAGQAATITNRTVGASAVAAVTKIAGAWTFAATGHTVNGAETKAQLSLNGASVTEGLTTSGTQFSEPLRLGAGGTTTASSHMNGVIAVVGVIEGRELTQQLSQSLQALYKSTLGTGLGLP
jgi:hypothetical protein